MVPQNVGGSVFDGNGHSITGVDPATGHFTGAVLQAQAGADSIKVAGVTVSASGLADVCDAGTARLRGILFDGVGGVITDNNVTGIEQGANGESGCQEGTGIDVRNEPFDTTGTDFRVTISDNTVTGDGPISYIAQNGIQVAYGATAIVKNNSSSENWYTPSSYVACGFLVYQADGVRASGNNFFNNERNQCNFGKSGGSFKPSNP